MEYIDDVQRDKDFLSGKLNQHTQV
jgi:hypothetical protein